MAVGKKTGGRVKGTPNKRTLGKEREIAASGLTPLDYMLGVMRDKTVDNDRRDEMAKAAAPYVHPRLQSTALTDPDGNQLVIRIVDDWARPPGERLASAGVPVAALALSQAGREAG